ncbi:uncharacterized protein LOC115739287 [Rhodamnia argentea]|uniref:Uncharacterized protein LOC115739287 n=1 Tax=Rhodamnia argentea TaxID=178133 RepID=A0A8B8P006_9MYRT|nr:uncharacterized protein LOC115739287 [Rhodamnia argentea]
MKMGIDKDGSKGGGYVGGFFQLFDWKAKSRKKLFSSRSELPEHNTKQGKRREGNLPMTRVFLVDEDETGMVSSAKGYSDYSCASSVTDDEGYGSKAPNVVARLMGLDSMPTNSLEPYSSPFFDTQSLRDSQRYGRNLDYPPNYQMMYSENVANKIEGPVRSNVESKPPQSQRIVNRPIEKFQTEVLPPKSAKSIPITQHRLLSPIKSPGFVPSRDAAHIMEAAAKILEPGPQSIRGKTTPIFGSSEPSTQLTMKTRMPMLDSSSGYMKNRHAKENEEIAKKISLIDRSSVPLKVRDLKEKVDVSQRTFTHVEIPQRPVESNAARFLKGHSLNKSWNGIDTSSYRGPPDKEEASSSSKSKGKSVSLAIQAKVNVQRRERLSSVDRSLARQQELSDNKLSQPFRSQPRTQKNSQKKSPLHGPSGILRQNNQKQNCLSDKERLPTKSSMQNLQGKRASSGDASSGDSSGRQKTACKLVGSSKAGSRKLDVLSSEKDNSQSNTKYFPRKKRSIDGEVHFEKTRAVHDLTIDKNRKAVQSHPTSHLPSNWAEDCRKNGMDVISFTFTAPLARSMGGSESSGQSKQKNSDFLGGRIFSQSDSMKSAPQSYNMVGSDALSKLLEQKLRELSFEVGSSSQDSAVVDSPSSSPLTFQDSAPTHNSVCSTLRSCDKIDQAVLFSSRLSSEYRNDLFAANQLPCRFNHDFQGVVEKEDLATKAKQLLDYRHPSPVSVLEPSFSAESCFSSDSMDSTNMEGTKQPSSQAAEILGLSFSRKSHLIEADMDLSDSASSLPTGRTVMRRHATAEISTDLLASNDWELEYVKEILCNVELMFRDFALGRAREIINPHLFEQLETRKGFMDSDDPTDSRLMRKVLFDCVSECMDSRCRRCVGGGCRKWSKGLAMVRNERLAEDLCKEILSWRGSGDSMVDDLVDKDMSGPNGKWRDFEAEAFVIGLEIEGDILGSLIDEAIADVLQ